MSGETEEVTGQQHNALGVHDVIMFIYVHIQNPQALFKDHLQRRKTEITHNPFKKSP